MTRIDLETAGISKVEDSHVATDVQERYVNIRLTVALGVINLSSMTNGNTGKVQGTSIPAIDYAESITTKLVSDADVVRPGYLVDEKYATKEGAPRYKYLGMAESCYSGRVIDVYYDKKTGYIFILPDLGTYTSEDEDMLEVSTITPIEGYIIGKASPMNSTLDEDPAGVTPMKFPVPIAGPRGFKTHMLQLPGLVSASPANNSGIMLTGSQYIEGNFAIPTQTLSLGSTLEMFGAGIACPTYRGYRESLTRYGFMFAGNREVKDMMVIINF